MVCYCDDCQSFAHFLGRADRLLDAHGGTEIFQTSPARVELTSGAQCLACVYLREGSGLLRWYSACCQTAIGNTLANHKDPFVGLILRGVVQADGVSVDDLLGPVRYRGNARFARGDRATLDAHARLPLSYWVRVSVKVLRWRLRGDGARSPFFSASGGPVVEPRVLSPDELHRVEMLRDQMR